MACADWHLKNTAVDWRIYMCVEMLAYRYHRYVVRIRTRTYIYCCTVQHATYKNTYLQITTAYLLSCGCRIRAHCQHYGTTSTVGGCCKRERTSGWRDECREVPVREPLQKLDTCDVWEEPVGFGSGFRTRTQITIQAVGALGGVSHLGGCYATHW